MSKSHISAQLRHQIREDAGNRCGYCRASEILLATELVIDHILPESADGPTTRDNLWLVCTRGNQFKGSKTHATKVRLTPAQISLKMR
jgi:5-methylcytosine-specific restriction endonuclease McrA